MNDFRFDYKKYESKHLTVEKLDDAFSAIVVQTPTIWDQVVMLIKLTVFGVYLWCRYKLISEKVLIEKQEYERKRGQTQVGDIGQDDLD